jgi:hypothetical protein
LLDKSKGKIESGLVEANKTIEYKLNPLNKGVYVFVMEGSIRREMKVLEKEIRSVLGNSIM